MKKIIKRSVAVSLICGALLLTNCGNNENCNLYNEFVQNINKDCDLCFSKIPYFSSWQFGNYNYVEICGYKPLGQVKHLSDAQTDYYKITYIVSLDDFNKLQDLNKNFEGLYPFNNDVIKHLNNIAEKYNPENVSPTILKENGEMVLD